MNNSALNDLEDAILADAAPDTNALRDIALQLIRSLREEQNISRSLSINHSLRGKILVDVVIGLHTIRDLCDLNADAAKTEADKLMLAIVKRFKSSCEKLRMELKAADLINDVLDKKGDNP